MVEYLLRCYGFCQAILFDEGNSFEYMQLPNQSGVRFGCGYYINQFRMRSSEIDSTKKHILGLGDSVPFGGAVCDQDSLAVTIFNCNSQIYQMLNISAGSWGPDNCAAYLNEYGTFDAQAIFLMVSSHDAHDNITQQSVVDIHPSYPSKQYKLAWVELFDRYVIPRIVGRFRSRKLDPDEKVVSENGLDIKKDGLMFNSGFDDIKKIADSLNIPMTIYLHADLKENREKKYNEQGWEIIQWADSNEVRLIQDITILNSGDYRDGIHLSNSGQRKLAMVMISEYGE